MESGLEAMCFSNAAASFHWCKYRSVIVSCAPPPTTKQQPTSLKPLAHISIVQDLLNLLTLPAIKQISLGLARSFASDLDALDDLDVLIKLAYPFTARPKRIGRKKEDASLKFVQTYYVRLEVDTLEGCSEEAPHQGHRASLE